MNKKTFATTSLCFLILLFLMTFGTTLSAYKVSKEKVEVQSIKLLTTDANFVITDKEGKKLTELEVKSSSVGIRPATGEEGEENSIPMTVNDEVGTEGAYACFYLTAKTDYKIILVSCKFENGYEENIDNVKMGVVDSKTEAISGKDINKTIYEGTKTDKKELVIVVWLDKDTTKSVKGSQIELTFEIKSK